MAELCPECLNKLNGTHYPDWWYILSDELDFCEMCEQWKLVVVEKRIVSCCRPLKKLFMHKRKK